MQLIHTCLSGMHCWIATACTLLHYTDACSSTAWYR